MQIPTMPSEPASVNPDAWDHYWSEVARYEVHLKNEKSKDYRREYYLERTRQRRIKKMQEYMNLFPDEARQYYEEHLQSN